MNKWINISNILCTYVKKLQLIPLLCIVSACYKNILVSKTEIINTDLSCVLNSLEESTVSSQLMVTVFPLGQLDTL